MTMTGKQMKNPMMMMRRWLIVIVRTASVFAMAVFPLERMDGIRPGRIKHFSKKTQVVNKNT
jgi:hypothetical protein